MFPTPPTVAAGRVLTANQADSSPTRTFPDLGNLTKDPGDLLMAIIIAYQSSASPAFSSWGGGFTEFFDSGTSSTLAIGAAYKWSTGSESGTFSVTQAATIVGHASMILLSIPGAHASTPPEGGSRADGTATAADAASFDPSGWTTEDALWIALCGSGETGTGGAYQGISAAPTNYTDYADTGMSGDAVGATEAAVAFRQLRASSENIGTFSVDISNARNSVLVIAVRPAPVNVLFTAEPGSYSATGSQAGVPAGRKIIASPTSYALSGTPTTTIAARTISSAPGAYDLSGLLAGIAAGRNVIAAPGTYGLSGAPVAFTKGIEMIAQPGSLALSGFSAGLAAARVVHAAPSDFAISGAPANVPAGRVLASLSATFAVSGITSGLRSDRLLQASPTSFALSGIAARVATARLLSVSTGSYSVIGIAAALQYSIVEYNSATELSGPRPGLEWV